MTSIIFHLETVYFCGLLRFSKVNEADEELDTKRSSYISMWNQKHCREKIF